LNIFYIIILVCKLFEYFAVCMSGKLQFMFLASVPKIILKSFPSVVWNIPATGKVIYLTFDDGPIPETTPWLLSILKSFQAKATFFCVGENVTKHTYLYNRLLNEGHAVGNHTFNHLVGWKTDTIQYIGNILKAGNYIDSKLFRPPHGLLTNAQFQNLKNDFRIIMWDVLSLDYDKKVSPEQCFRNVKENIRPGSIVVFHDSIKAWKNLEYTLPRTLEYFSSQGYSFASIDYGALQLPKPSFIENWLNAGYTRKRA
jgi:peptidoglycan-N-acetylglucosamine deacetylase